MPSFWTVTIIVLLGVEARCSVLTRIWTAMVIVILALVSSESYRTNTSVTVYQVVTFSSVFARIRSTIVDISGAVPTCISWLASTVIVVDQINASCSVLTLSNAVVDVLIAVFFPSILLCTYRHNRPPNLYKKMR